MRNVQYNHLAKLNFVQPHTEMGWKKTCDRRPLFWTLVHTYTNAYTHTHTHMHTHMHARTHTHAHNKWYAYHCSLGKVHRIFSCKILCVKTFSSRVAVTSWQTMIILRSLFVTSLIQSLHTSVYLAFSSVAMYDTSCSGTHADTH